MEGGVEQAEVIKALVSAGIPVMTHCGLRRKTYIGWADIGPSATKRNCSLTSGQPKRLRIRHRLGVHTSRRRDADQQDPENSHHRDRLRGGVRRANTGPSRSLRFDPRRRAATCQGIRRSEKRHRSGRNPISRRSSRRGISRQGTGVLNPAPVIRADTARLCN